MRPGISRPNIFLWMQYLISFLIWRIIFFIVGARQIVWTKGGSREGKGENHAVRGITPWKEASKSLLASPLCPLLLQYLPSAASFPFSLISCAEKMNKFRRKARTLQTQLNALTVLTLLALMFLLQLVRKPAVEGRKRNYSTFLI